MIELDLFGLLLTVIIVGPSQAHLVVLASLLQEGLRVLAALALGRDLLAVTAGGAFGTTAAEGLAPLALGLAGPALLALLAMSLIRGRESALEALVPWRESRYRFAAVALRLAVLTAVITVAFHPWAGGGA